jgi:hypothetical protein
MYEIYLNPGPRCSTFGGGDVRRDKNLGTRIAGPETSAAVIGEICGEFRSEPAFLFNFIATISSNKTFQVFSPTFSICLE